MVNSTGTNRVVIVGGGVGGAHLYKSLESHADVTLIDPKPYFEIPWAMPRCMVEPGFAERSVFLHREYMPNGRLITSSAVDATDTDVVTASGEHVPYDFLVIATGSAYDGPSTKKDRLKQFEAGHTCLPVALECHVPQNMDHPSGAHHSHRIINKNLLAGPLDSTLLIKIPWSNGPHRSGSL